MKKLSIGLLVALSATVLSGCALYFGEDHDDDSWTYCGSDGYYTCQDENCQWVSATCPDSGSGGGWGSGSGGGGFSCEDNNDCAAGCYCADNGTCEEAGFCTQDSDCGEGYECNEERSSCEPTTTLAGTCESGTDPAGTCAGEATCNLTPPVCAPGDVPLLGADGCWTGECQSTQHCAEAPSCSHINDQASCAARTDCAQTVNGINCKKSDGTACQAGDTGCSCDSYVFASCRNAAL